jgi:hypothetical protein
MAEVASERLNYLSKKQRAVSSRASRQIIPCSNGVTFNAGQTARIDLAGNQMATYLDMQDSYLKFTVNNGDDAAIQLESAYALIDRLEILCDGATVSSIAQYGACVHSYLDTEVGQDWKVGLGRGLAGTYISGDFLTQIGASGSKTFCIPLVLTPVFQANKYWPMMARSTLSIRITWASAAKGTIGAATDAQITINPCEFVGSFVRLSAEANAMVMANTQGRFEIITSDIRTAEGNLTENDTVLNVNCGFSFSSLDRISFGIFPTLNTALAMSVSNRAAATLQEFSLSINGEEHPRRRIQVSETNVAETYAEIAVAHRSLADFGHTSSLSPYHYSTASTGALPAIANRFYVPQPSGLVGTTGEGNFDRNTGKAIFMIDTESMKPHSDPDALYSGLSTLGSVVQLVGTLTLAPASVPILVFAQYTLAMTLDMNGSQTWVVSI